VGEGDALHYRCVQVYASDLINCVNRCPKAIKICEKGLGQVVTYPTSSSGFIGLNLAYEKLQVGKSTKWQFNSEKLVLSPVCSTNGCSYLKLKVQGVCQGR